MAFMEPDVYHGRAYEVDTNNGEGNVIPCDVCPGARHNSDLSDYVLGTIDEPDEAPTIRTGWLARLSAPGYMDCAEWTIHSTEAEAREYLSETYGDDDTDGAE